MSATGPEVFDKSIQSTSIWLDEIMEDMGPDRQRAWHMLGAVLRTMRDRLPPDLAASLGAQLPLVVRGACYDQYRPSALPERTRSLDAFPGKIEDELKFGRRVNTQDALRVACSVLARHVDDGQIAKVWETLPADIREAATAKRHS